MTPFTVKSRISYLKAKIEATKSQLVLRGKLNQDAQSNTGVSAIEEEKSGEFSASDTKYDFEEDDMIDVEVQQLAGDKNEDSLVPTEELSSGSGNPGLSRGSILSMLGMHSSFTHRSNSEKTSFNESTSSAPRFSFFDDVGMPSRWKAREMERSKEFEDDEAFDGGEDATPKNEDCSPVNVLATKLQTLISQRESEIAVLEKQTKKMEMETTSFHHKMAALQNEHESNMAVSKRERDDLIKSITMLEKENQKLDEQLLETGVILQEKEISRSLLEKQLRDARNQLYMLQSMKKASKNKGKLESRTSDAQPEQGVQGDLKYKVATFNEEDDNRKSPSRGVQRRGSNNSMVSALTLDFDDIVDILDGSGRSDELDEMLGSLTSSKNSSSLSR
jgi:predicted  nucleic acid-binding Zn-ribbon protein